MNPSFCCDYTIIHPTAVLTDIISHRFIGQNSFTYSGVDLNYTKFFRYEYRSHLRSSSSVYRENGAFDGDDYYSVECQTFSGGTSLYVPSYFKLIDFYQSGVYAITVRIEFAQASGSAPLTSEDLTIDIIYPNSASNQAHRNTTKVPYNLSPSDLATSDATWVGLTNPVKQYISITTTSSRAAGMCTIFVRLGNSAGTSITAYFCPKPIISY